MKVARLIMLAAAALAAVALVAGGGTAAVSGKRLVGSAHGTSHWTILDMFGLQRVEVGPFTFHAKLYSDGALYGRYSFRDWEDGTVFTIAGRITCATFRGNRAWFGGVVERTNDPSIAGFEMWFQVADNESSGGADVSTLLGLSAVPDSALDYCNAAPDPRFPWLLERGDIVVRSVGPEATS